MGACDSSNKRADLINAFEIPNNYGMIKNDYQSLNKAKSFMKQKFSELQRTSYYYYQDFQKQPTYISNYKNYLNNLYHEINGYEGKSNISIMGCGNWVPQNAEIENCKYQLENISYKIIELEDTVNLCQCVHLKKLEKYHEDISKIFLIEDQIEKNCANDQKLLCEQMFTYNNFISNKLNLMSQVSYELKNYHSYCKNAKQEIESKINYTKKQIEIAVSNSKKNRNKEFIKHSGNLKKNTSFNRSITNNFQDKNTIDPMFLKGSMLLGVNNFGEESDIFKTRLIFNQKNQNYDYEESELLNKDWHEICEIHEKYDLHEINYVLLAVGLDENCFFTSCSLGFILDRKINILIFEIDGQKSPYELKNSSLKFPIKLSNMQSNRIHLKYTEAKKLSKLSQGSLSELKFFRSQYYGLLNNVSNQMAKYTLKIKCDFEVIDIENNTFRKTAEKEYSWGGCVPEGGLQAIVTLSKSIAKWEFFLKDELKSATGKNISNTKLTTPIPFEGGNNKIINFDYKSNNTNNIKKDLNKRTFVINFINTNVTKVDFIIKGSLINRCKGEWVCNLTDAQIEENTPEEYKKKKNEFKIIAQNIIKNYDNNNKKNFVKILDPVKIGKWVNKNIKYDIAYTGKTDMSAMDIYNQKVGVCHHFTILYNALLYSIGYKAIYVSGYAVKKKDFFDISNAHAWSLVQINGKWFPFDSTWNILTGKLPVSHVFQNYFSIPKSTVGSEHIKIVEPAITGEFVE